MQNLEYMNEIQFLEKLKNQIDVACEYGYTPEFDNIIQTIESRIEALTPRDDYRKFNIDYLYLSDS